MSDDIGWFIISCNEEFFVSALDFMDRKTAAGEPWFSYMNTTRVHIFTHQTRIGGQCRARRLMPRG